MAKEKTGTMAGAAVIAGAGIEAGKGIIRDLAKNVGEHLTSQFKESIGGLGVKDEGNYNAVINAWATATGKKENDQGEKIEVLVFSDGVTNAKKLETWMKKKLTSRQQRWFIRVIANMLADELAVREKGTEKKDALSVTEAAIVIARELNSLVKDYPDENEWITALYARRLIKQDYLDEGYQLFKQYLIAAGEVWEEVIEKMRDRTKEAEQRYQVFMLELAGAEIIDDWLDSSDGSASKSFRTSIGSMTREKAIKTLGQLVALPNDKQRTKMASVRGLMKVNTLAARMRARAKKVRQETKRLKKK
ncbi:hypothetical protein KKD19_03985 [Patescibacteria group bacterium]|nr:hypothetical protein [Patescibacteria group bacterium]MBU4512367.1 hypothetical protein [Patescibacteria group bacterium]MCG2692793.1 hypothetical protein [Candidatus Parcubacteria bacterium]